MVVTVSQKLPTGVLGASAIVPAELGFRIGKVVGTDVVEDATAFFTPDQDSATYRPVPGGCDDRAPRLGVPRHPRRLVRRAG